jgi:diguanylate cyclase (GGDEF)-like protein
VDGGDPRILQSLPVTETNVPLSLINYVARTGTSVVLDDALQPDSTHPGVDRDPYLHAHRVRSVLCLPILSGIDDKRELTGVLYLENNRAAGTFTHERLGTLEIICIAAAGRLELSRKAAVDGLTQLFNYDYFQNVLAREFAAATRHVRKLALILIDIDQFKTFNDSWGHQLGDQVLQEVGRLIKNSSRADDTVARYGGEEMAVILPGASADEAEAVAERIRAAVERHRIDHNGTPLTVKISLGVAVLDATTPDPAALIGRADRALYASKANGRNRVTVA